MNDDKLTSTDPVNNLFAGHHREWVCVPRRVLIQIALVGLLLGVALALLVMGILFDVEELKWVWPAVVLTLMLATKFLPWWRGDRFEEQLRSASGKD